MENISVATPVTERHFGESSFRTDEHSSGVSWSAVIGGAFVGAAISLIMLALGAGFGLSAVSPWSNVGASASTISTAAIAWLIVTQVVASALGGYLAGRLRTKWVAIHSDEVHFRDTANGFLVWAVGLVLTVTFLVSSAASMVGSAAVGGAAGSSAPRDLASDRSSVDPHGYYVDRLFRSEAPNAQPVDPSVYAEAGRVLANPDSSGADQTYLAKVVAARTGLSQADAEQRVSQVISDARQAADTARKAAARLLLWIFVALLAGAFCASFAATIGGRQRDHVKVI